MKKTFFISMLLMAFLASFCYTARAQQTLSVGVLIVDDIDDSDPDLITESAVISQDVYYDGKILFAAGTPVVMDISYQHHRGLGVPGSVTVRPVSTTDIYGQAWVLNAGERTATGTNRRGAAIGCGVFFGIVAFPVGLLFLCIKGGDAEIVEGTLMVATVQVNRY